VLHQVGVSFDLYYDARKHKSKMFRLNTKFWDEAYRGLSFRRVSPLITDSM